MSALAAHAPASSSADAAAAASSSSAAPLPIFKNLTAWIAPPRPSATAAVGDASSAAAASAAAAPAHRVSAEATRQWLLHGGALQADAGADSARLFLSEDNEEPTTQRLQSGGSFVLYHPRWILACVEAGSLLPLAPFVLPPAGIQLSTTAKFFAMRPQQRFTPTALAGSSRVLPPMYRGSLAAEDEAEAVGAVQEGGGSSDAKPKRRAARRKAPVEEVVPVRQLALGERDAMQWAELMHPPPPAAHTAAAAAASSSASSKLRAPLDVSTAPSAQTHVIREPVKLEPVHAAAPAAAPVAAAVPAVAPEAVAPAAAPLSTKKRGRKRRAEVAAAAAEEATGAAVVEAGAAPATAAAASSPAAARSSVLQRGCIPSLLLPDLFSRHWQRRRPVESLKNLMPYCAPSFSKVAPFAVQELEQEGGGAAGGEDRPVQLVPWDLSAAAEEEQVLAGGGGVEVAEPEHAIAAAAAPPAKRPRGKGKARAAPAPAAAPETVAAQQPSPVAAVEQSPLAGGGGVQDESAEAPAVVLKAQAKRKKRKTSVEATAAPARAAAIPIAPAARTASAAAAASSPVYSLAELDRAEETLAMSSLSALHSLARMLGVMPDEHALTLAERTDFQQLTQSDSWRSDMKRALLAHFRG